MKNLDSAILAQCCDRTGGRFHLLSGSMLAKDNAQRLREELCHSMAQVCATEVKFKLRTSRGIRVGTYCGLGKYDSITEEADCAGLDTDSTVCYTLGHDGTSIKDEDKIHLQLAVLHTRYSRAGNSSEGTAPGGLRCQRVVRVLNFCAIATTIPSVSSLKIHTLSRERSILLLYYSFIYFIKLILYWWYLVSIFILINYVGCV